MEQSEVPTESPVADVSYALTDGQQIALAVAPVPTALLSIASSALIIHNVLHQKKGTKRNSFHRILLAMSVFDILYSLNACLQTFLLPALTSPRLTAVGNHASCNALGFLMQLSYATYWYNGVLSLYFLVTIVYKWSDDKVRRYLEPAWHVTCVLFALVTASMGAVFGWYSEQDMGFGCWVNDFPRGCEKLNETTGEMGEACLSDDIAWLIAGIPITLSLLLVIFINIRIYCHVRAVLLKSQRHNFARSVSSTSLGSLTASSHNNSNSDNQLRRMRQVAIQGFFYVAAFWMTGIFSALVRIVEGYDLAADESGVYPLLFLQAVWAPSTGFFNMVVYFRPRYLRCRQNFPYESRWWACQRTVLGLDVRPQSAVEIPRQTRSRLGLQTASHVTFEEPPVPPDARRGHARKPEPNPAEGEKSQEVDKFKSGELKRSDFEVNETHSRLMRRLGADQRTEEQSESSTKS
uniref:G-protein coupled receptors family 2 profile 2 domain-containing protein n=1 Tax=Amphora coffeiformis TaxID=265554 RepID=A0A7S3PAK5_9STRA|mmetsp:Transcript_9650/g.18433  ORF Transcript_9650/g.18433 Transcript_9650/m.18433 type:complete len:464 (+) Transcript_9650:111-1502(+)